MLPPVVVHNLSSGHKDLVKGQSVNHCVCSRRKLKHCTVRQQVNRWALWLSQVSVGQGDCHSISTLRASGPCWVGSSAKSKQVLRASISAHNIRTQQLSWQRYLWELLSYSVIAINLEPVANWCISCLWHQKLLPMMIIEKMLRAFLCATPMPRVSPYWLTESCDLSPLVQCCT